MAKKPIAIIRIAKSKIDNHCEFVCTNDYFTEQLSDYCVVLIGEDDRIITSIEILR